MAPHTKRTATTGKRGRPRWEPPDLRVVEKLASRGLTQTQIAAALGISLDTLIARKKDYAVFFDAIKRGAAAGLADVTNSLYQEACSGNVTATIFYLKNRDPLQWNDRREVYRPSAED